MWVEIYERGERMFANGSKFIELSHFFGGVITEVSIRYRKGYPLRSNAPVRFYGILKPDVGP